jgi:hypothetical protein
MKVLALLPLTYLAGVEGFAIFAPYAAIAFSLWMFSRRAKRA